MLEQEQEQEQEAPSSASEVNQVPHIEEEVQQEESSTIPEMSQVSPKEAQSTCRLQHQHQGVNYCH